MKTSLFTMMMICLVVTSVFSQSNLNDYKYVIVAKKYDFLKEADQYQLNSLSKFLFNKYGFEALMEGEKYPEDLLKNRCLALNADALKDSGMFKTKLTVQLTDCYDQLVYTTNLGVSKEKEFKKAYVEAIRDAFKSFETVNHKYQPKENTTAVTAEETLDKKEVVEEIEKLKEEIQALKQEKKEEVVEVAKTKVIPKVLKSEPNAEVPAEKIKEKVKSVIVEEKLGRLLYAQAISNGYQLVDSTPKVVMTLLRTALDDVFIVKDKNAIVFKTEEFWNYSDNRTAIEILNIKF